MARKIFGKKMGMTRYFLDEGKSVPVTIIKTWPCVVTQKKTKTKDGYDAVQVGFDEKKSNKVTKPLQGHFKAAGDKCFKFLREIQVEDVGEFELGQEIKADIFSIGEFVKVCGKSKGRGYSGVVKRWGFAGGKDTHGCRSHKVPGSIGMSATPGRVAKGRKLPGRMGYQKTTVKNLQIVDVRPEMDMIAIKGPVPGSRNSIVEISAAF